MPSSISCTWCGNEFAPAVAPTGPTVECPKCGTACGVPAGFAVPKRRKDEKPAPPVLDKAEPSLLALDEPGPAIKEDDPLDAPARLIDDDEDDGRPYEMTTPVKRCPHCGRILEEQDVACPRCKYDLKTKQIPIQTFEPIKRRWEAGWPLATRVRGFILYESGLIVLAVVFSWWSGAIFPFLFLSATLLFIAGSYDRIDLTRSAKGKITLSKTWRICFVEQRPIRLVLGDYESTGTSMHAERNFMDGAVVVWLLFCGILPGVLWYIFVFNRPTFQAALCKDHGYAAFILYRGKDEKHMRDLAETVSEVCQFPVGLY